LHILYDNIIVVFATFINIGTVIVLPSTTIYAPEVILLPILCLTTMLLLSPGQLTNLKTEYSTSPYNFTDALHDCNVVEYSYAAAKCEDVYQETYFPTVNINVFEEK
jgi:hypothetical protein